MFYKIILVMATFMLVSCSSSNSNDLPTLVVMEQSVETAEPTSTRELIKTEEAVEPEEFLSTEEPAKTQEALVTDEPMDTQVASETEESGTAQVILPTDDPNEITETEEPDATPEVVDIENPLPANANGYYIAPSYATIEEGANVNDIPENHRWVVATVTLANETGDRVDVNSSDIYLIGDDGNRYSTDEMIERVKPKLVGSQLDADESVYGFALFALPNEIEPKLFEWCVGGDCGAPLQAPISLQEE